MPRINSGSKDREKKSRPATTPEARENYLISLAEDAAEKQLKAGTASPSVIVHYLKLGTVKAQEELEVLRLEKKVLEAKADAYESQKKSEELYGKAIDAMRGYTSSATVNDVEPEELQ